MVAAWLTAALFVIIAGVFTIPYAVQFVSEGCTDTLRLGGWGIVKFGPILHYLAGAVLVTFLALIRREETECSPALRGTLPWPSPSMGSAASPGGPEAKFRDPSM
ncbi:hypothetical protein [Nonomuraea sp. NPDC050202]|uniref:hypothetical protein n=1 Tax=Nonomuraea sp. NPDC050202 TaxID=3155035 RepID=UPI0033FF1806